MKVERVYKTVLLNAMFPSLKEVQTALVKFRGTNLVFPSADTIDGGLVGYRSSSATVWLM